MDSDRFSIRLDLVDWVGGPSGDDPTEAEMVGALGTAVAALPESERFEPSVGVDEDGAWVATSRRSSLVALVRILQSRGLVDERVGEADIELQGKDGAGRDERSRFSVYVQATDWLALPAGTQWDELNGSAVAAEIRRYLRLHPVGSRVRFLFDPEGDGVSVHAATPDPLSGLVRRLQTAGLLDEDAELEVLDDDEAGVVNNESSSAQENFPEEDGVGRIMGPYRSAATPPLTGYLSKFARSEWGSLSGDDLVAVVRAAIAKLDLVAAMTVFPDGPDMAIIEGNDPADFEALADELGLAGTDPTEA